MVAGSSRNATSSAGGLFRFDSLTAGTYDFILQHPFLDSIGLSEWTVRATIRSARDTIRLAIPSAARLWSALCGPGAMPADSGFIFGSIRVAGRPNPSPVPS